MSTIQNQSTRQLPSLPPEILIIILNLTLKDTLTPDLLLDGGGIFSGPYFSYYVFLKHARQALNIASVSKTFFVVVQVVLQQLAKKAEGIVKWHTRRMEGVRWGDPRDFVDFRALERSSYVASRAWCVRCALRNAAERVGVGASDWRR